MSSSGPSPFTYQSPQVKEYCNLPNNEIVTGFIIDFLNSLQIQSTKRSFVEDLPV